MKDVVSKLEEERRKLNALGELSLRQSIPLSDNQDVLDQSREVDKWMARFVQAKRKQVDR